MFDYCSLIKANCSFAAKQKEITYCGLATGTQVETRVDYLKKRGNSYAVSQRKEKKEKEKR
jgi:hypothetical protein